MTYRVRFTREARADLTRLFQFQFQFQLERDLRVARRARRAIGKGLELLRDFPFTCRKAVAGNPFLRELVIPFGDAGYVALFEIEDARTVTVLAVRHQLEEDYH